MKIETVSENTFTGEIGNNMNYTREEREEDILETLYLWWRDGKLITEPDICVQFDMSRREVSHLIKKMIEHGYLMAPDEEGQLRLTSYGKTQGAECVFRHQNLTQFLQMTCGMDEQHAEENACRIEHVVSEEVIHGICEFMKYGDCYERTVRNANLCMFYEEGTYEFCMGIYCAEQRYPRVLAEEHQVFSSTIRLEVANEQSFIYLKKKKYGYPEQLWYKGDYEWKQAEQVGNEYKIPTEIFSFTCDPEMFITEGYGIIAFSKDEASTDERNYRELNIHLW